MELNLEPKERLGLIIGGFTLFLVIALLFYIPSGPRERYEQAKQSVQSAHNDLNTSKLILASEQERLLQQEQLMERLEGRDSNFDFMAFMDRQLRDNNLVARAELSYPRRARNAPENQSMVQLRLDGVALNELIDFLYKVYESQNLIVMHRLDLRPATNDRGLSCDLVFVTITST